MSDTPYGQKYTWLEGVTEGVLAGKDKDGNPPTPFKIKAVMPMGGNKTIGETTKNPTFAAGTHEELVAHAQKYFRGASQLQYRLVCEEHLPARASAVPEPDEWPPKYGTYAIIDVRHFCEKGEAVMIRPFKQASVGKGGLVPAPAQVPAGDVPSDEDDPDWPEGEAADE